MDALCVLDAFLWRRLPFTFHTLFNNLRRNQCLRRRRNVRSGIVTSKHARRHEGPVHEQHQLISERIRCVRSCLKSQLVEA